MAVAMLEYETQLFLQAVQDSELFIFGYGISIEKVLTNLFRTYATDVNLVLILSASSEEETYFKTKLEGEKIMSITTEFSPNERKELYAGGGVFFITSRILVVDFLKDVIPAEAITGIVILRAHDVLENSQEAFILRLYRTKNKTGFIKAFSHSPTTFLLGYSRISRVMRSCFIANFSLWPRFHAAVKESLSKLGNDTDTGSVIEIQLQLTENMREIQTNLLDLVTWSISELKRLVPAVSNDEVTVETALTKGFEKIVGAYLDPVWNTINSQAKDILNELKVFRLLLTQLTKADSVSFYSTLCNYTGSEAVYKSSWLLSKAAENIILAARRRIFLKDKASKEKTDKESSNIFEPEVHPKWAALSEILTEITIKQEKNDEDDSFAAKLKTIVFTEDIKTCSVLRDYLSDGSLPTLGKIARNSENLKIELPPDLIAKLNSLYRQKQQDKDKMDSDGNKSLGKTEIQITLTQIERKYEDIEFLQTPVFIRPTKSFGEPEAFAISETLDTLRPDVIVLFDPSLELVRNVEIYRARIAETQPVKVYFLVFHNSIEEQMYLTSIQREKFAFEKLIEEKATMVVPVEREAKDELNQDLWRDPTKASEATTSLMSKRNMQIDNDGVQHIILVDMREFRSELPSLIHKRGIDLEPITLDVGDYILTPEICVERKSISDLIGSLNSGRLYKQAEAMTRHYKKPVLLIEHEQQTHEGRGGGMRYRNDLNQIMPKLQILTVHFPNIRIIWSPGAHYTSEVFHELKRGKDQPSVEQALAIQKETMGVHSTSKYNPVSHSLLSRMPGIDSRNVYHLLNRCDSLGHVVNLSLEDLSTVLESSQSANLLYAGFHAKLTESHGPSTSGSSSSASKSKGLGPKSKSVRRY